MESSLPSLAKTGLARRVAPPVEAGETPRPEAERSDTERAARYRAGAYFLISWRSFFSSSVLARYERSCNQVPYKFLLMDMRPGIPFWR